MAQHSTQTTQKKSSGWFDGLSIAQVIAGALAAVTSMLLSSQIGITGSVIGVAVGSVVATLSSQLYKRFLEKSSEKLRRTDEAETASASDDPYATRKLGTVQAAPGDSSAQAAQRYARGTYGGDAASVRARQQRKQSGVPSSRKRKVQLGVIVVSVVTALITVAVWYFLVNVSTQGEGIGTKTAPLVATDANSTAASSRSAGTGVESERTSAGTTPSVSSAPSDDTATADANTSSTAGSSSDASSSSTGATTGSSASTGASSSKTDSAAVSEPNDSDSGATDESLVSNDAASDSASSSTSASSPSTTTDSESTSAASSASAA